MAGEKAGVADRQVEVAGWGTAGRQVEAGARVVAVGRPEVVVVERVVVAGRSALPQ
jgi:hypothetical protein